MHPASPLDDLRAEWVQHFYAEWVRPFYMRLWGAPFEPASSEREQWAAALRERVQALTPSIADMLLGARDWRARGVGGHLVGFRGWADWTPRLVELLTEGGRAYAGSMYVFGLARLATADAAAGLERYLDTWLPRREAWHDQRDALAALLHLDDVRGEQRATRFLTPGGLWDEFRRDKPHHDLARARQQLAQSLDFYAAIIPPGAGSGAGSAA